jgi:RNA polymerase-binding transcription factor DksA
MAEDNEARLELLSRLHERAAALERALGRLKQGVYPLCAECAKAIHHERLEALPETDVCLRCQERLEETRSLERRRARRLPARELVETH